MRNRGKETAIFSRMLCGGEVRWTPLEPVHSSRYFLLSCEAMQPRQVSIPLLAVGETSLHGATRHWQLHFVTSQENQAFSGVKQNNSKTVVATNHKAREIVELLRNFSRCVSLDASAKPPPRAPQPAVAVRQASNVYPGDGSVGVQNFPWRHSVHDTGLFRA